MQRFHSLLHNCIAHIVKPMHSTLNAFHACMPKSDGSYNQWILQWIYTIVYMMQRAAILTQE